MTTQYRMTDIYQLKEHKEYFSNGNLKCHYFTKLGIKDGEYKEWYFDKQLKELSHYHNGFLEGSYQYWFVTGQLRIDATYLQGKLLKSLEYYLSGQKYMDYSYDENQQYHGICTIWLPNGSIQFQTQYEHGSDTLRS